MIPKKKYSFEATRLESGATTDDYMRKIRLIARLDIKGPNLIKGIHLEGLRVIGSPNEHALKYYKQGVDELIYIDCVASLYGRNSLGDIIQDAARDVFVPMTVGGGIRSVEDAAKLLRCGADKVAVNSAATKRPELISEISRRFGSQCTVLSIEAKRRPDGGWQVFTDNGREPAGLDVVAWAAQGEALGAGEILLTSVDLEGTRKGYDVELCREVSSQVAIPVILSGGMGEPRHLLKAAVEGKADALAVADAIHYKRHSIEAMKLELHQAGLKVRTTKATAGNAAIAGK